MTKLLVLCRILKVYFRKKDYADCAKDEPSVEGRAQAVDT